MHLWTQRNISTKLIVIFAACLIGVVAIQAFSLISDHREATKDEMINRAAAFTALADETKNYVGQLGRDGAFDHEALMAELSAEMAADPNYDYTKSRVFNTIPVVAGWTAAAEAAEREGLNFYTPAFDARNPDNEPGADTDPSQGAFREELLRELYASVEAGGPKEIHRINEQTNTLHYLRAIILDSSCMSCHGTPGNPEHDPDGDGLDPLGFPMENWAIGDMHGAFEIAMPLDELDQGVASFLAHSMVVLVPAMVLGLGAIIWFIRGAFSKPMGQLLSQLRDVSEGDGDLTARLGFTRSDEIGQVSRFFDGFMDRLHTTISGVRDATNAVSESASSIGSATDQVAGGMSSTASQVTQIAAAMEQMSQTAEEVASRSQEASSRTDRAGVEAAEGRSIVETTVGEIRQIAEHVNESARAVQSLGDRGQKIGEVISVINDIADQTNLLALNAAIEAARAGEHGRGFAVVADEVRKLAERTTVATEEVSSSISAIQGETEQAVVRMDTGRERVDAGVELAGKAGDACEKIVEGSASVASIVESIAAAAAEQAATANDVSRNIEQIDSVTRDTTSSANEMAASAQTLTRHADVLAGLVAQFKL